MNDLVMAHNRSSGSNITWSNTDW